MNEEKNADPQQQRTHQHIPASFVIRVEKPTTTANVPDCKNRDVPTRARFHLLPLA